MLVSNNLCRGAIPEMQDILLQHCLARIEHSYLCIFMRIPIGAAFMQGSGLAAFQLVSLHG